MKITRKLPTVEVLNDWFVEEPLGILRWRKTYVTERNGATVIGHAGEIAGRTNQSRWQIHFQGRTYYRSRLIYKLHTGKEPQVLQYINGNSLDDSFENLKSIPNNPNVRYSRERDAGFFIVKTRTGVDGRTVKTVMLSWRCGPDEDAEAIAAELNSRNEDYLRQLNRERLAREGERGLMNVTEAQRQSASAAIQRLKKPTLEEEQEVA